VGIAAHAQDTAPPPAHISFVEGTATIEHDGESEPAVVNFPVVEGDRIRTLNGRVEIMFPDASSIAIDPNSEVELLSAMRVRVLAGGIEHRPAPAVDPRAPSTQYLPPDLQAYGQTLDQNGSWDYESSYGGYVWYPTVAADWRPYYYGYWSPVPRYGLTWIGFGAWAWPTHHYGRWGYAHSRWYWMPGRTWSTAWVSWGSAPGYVSWCPLGYDGRAVVGLSVGYQRGWNAWTVIPRDRFGVGRYAANRYAIEPYRLASTTPFVLHRNAPAIRPGHVVGVGPAPANANSVGVAVPRNGQWSSGDSRRQANDARPSTNDPRLSTNDSRPSTGRPRAPHDPSVAAGSQAIPGGTTVPRYGPVGQQPGAGSQQPATGNPPPPAGSGERATARPRRNVEREGGSATDHPAYRPNYSPTYDPNRTYSDRGPDRREPDTARPVTRDRAPVYQAPTYQQPTYQQPIYQPPAYQRPTTGDPAGRAEPRAMPRDVPNAAPRDARPPSYDRGAPREQPRPSPERAAPREQRPSPPPSAPARSSPGVRSPDSGPSHAREPHGGGDRGGSSSGTATRRPR
jgi:hypothetical protein